MLTILIIIMFDIILKYFWDTKKKKSNEKYTSNDFTSMYNENK